MKDTMKDLKDKGAKIGIIRPKDDPIVKEPEDVSKKMLYRLGIDASDLEAIKVFLALMVMIITLGASLGLAVGLAFTMFRVGSGG
jgi:hypothetical protein